MRHHELPTRGAGGAGENLFEYRSASSRYSHCVNKPGVGSVVPAQGQSIVGRAEDLALISSLLRAGSDRMITLVGPGGIGKSCLAAEAARDARTRGVQVHWVRLARLPVDSDYAAVERETASTVIKADYSKRNTWDALVAALDQTDKSGRARPVVLVLDNCEHVLAGLGLLIPALLDAVPGLIVLATSRSPTGWIDERLIPVRQLREADALTLFKQRAELTGCATIDPGDEGVVAEICAHVGCNPLFIRLAAARLRHQSLMGLRAEVTGRADDRRMRWMSGPGSGADERHRGVTNVIAWSYDLCDAEERLLFERLSVFAAGGDTEGDTARTTGEGADIEAIEAVCGDEQTGADGQTLPRHEIEGLLERLVDKSLVTIHITSSAVWYSVVESLRLFARDRLTQRGPDERTRLARRHLYYYRDKVVDASRRWFSPAERELLDRARAAWDNIVSAIETSITTPGEARAGLEICVGLIQLRVPFVRGSIREIRDWTEQCLDASETLTPQPSDLQLVARSAIAWLAIRQGQSEDATRLLEDCITTCISDGTDWQNNSATVEGLPAILDLAWGTQMFMSAQNPLAVDVLQRACRKFHESNDHGAAVFAGMFAGMAAALLDTTGERASGISCATVERARESGASWATSWSLLAWAVTLIKHGDPAQATEVLRGTLAHQMDVGDQWGAAWSVELRCWALAAVIKAGTTDRERVATEIAHLAGGAKTLRSSLGVDIGSMGTFAVECLEAIKTARQVLGDVTFIAQMNRGAQQLRPSTFDVHRLALGEISLAPAPSGTATDPTAAPWDSLSPAEKEVALLVAEGQTNNQIARHRTTSPKTVDKQVASILSKMGIPSREHVHEYIPENHKLPPAPVSTPRPVGHLSARRRG
ncbi:LuxR C-terminal-related transcriptional regulator [Nocardia sp. NPDC050710]|uniref:helix-turn-helix transcriptional regulator n=1 Tax=Nocardia sp. NPDC050710 TaxID=3157220 RepID=UPI00340CC375